MAATLKRVGVLICCWAVVFSVIVALSQFTYIPIRHRAKIYRARLLFVIETVLLIANCYIWRQSFPSSDDCHKIKKLHQADDARFGTRFLQMFMLTFMILAQLSYFTNIWFMDTHPHLFPLLCYVCLAALINVIFGLLGVTFLARTGCLFTKLRKHHLVILAFFYAVAVTTVGLYNASLPPPVKHVHIPIRNLPHSMENMHIVQISDIHLGPTIGHHRLQGIVDIVNGLKPDIIVLTGDLVDGSADALKYAAMPLKQLKAKYSKYFVTGNHEYYTGDVENWLKYLSELGFVLLHNDHAAVHSREKPDDFIYIAGTDDIMADKIGYDGHGMRLAEAVRDCSDGHPVILLAHQPKAAKTALDSRLSTNIELVLSGHTHGGQMFPFNLAVYFMNPFFRGLYAYKGKHVYVNEGTQFWGFPVRFGTSMEITDIVLTTHNAKT